MDDFERTRFSRRVATLVSPGSRWFLRKQDIEARLQGQFFETGAASSGSSERSKESSNSSKQAVEAAGHLHEPVLEAISELGAKLLFEPVALVGESGGDHCSGSSMVASEVYQRFPLGVNLRKVLKLVIWIWWRRGFIRDLPL